MLFCIQARRLTDKETYLAERKALEAKYSAIYQTSYAARAGLLRGAVRVGIFSRPRARF